MNNSMTAMFVGPDDSETCKGCDEAVNNNPYTVDDVPTPGDFECMANCRHMIQLASDAPLDTPTITWSGSLGFTEQLPEYATALEERKKLSYNAKATVELLIGEGVGADGIAWLVNHIGSDGMLHADPVKLAHKIVEHHIEVTDLTPYLNPTMLEAVQKTLQMLSAGSVETAIQTSLESNDVEGVLHAFSESHDAVDYAKQLATEGFDNVAADQAMTLADALTEHTGMRWKALLDTQTNRWTVKAQ